MLRPPSTLRSTTTGLFKRSIRILRLRSNAFSAKRTELLVEIHKIALFGPTVGKSVNRRCDCHQLSGEHIYGFAVSPPSGSDFERTCEFCSEKEHCSTASFDFQKAIAIRAMLGRWGRG